MYGEAILYAICSVLLKLQIIGAITMLHFTDEKSEAGPQR